MSTLINPTWGSIGVPAFFSLPQLPAVLLEWVSLIPLVVHLTNAQDDFNLIGEACLRGSITTPLFPKLGQLKGIAKLLSADYYFLDTVAARSAGAVTAWDVSWGSVFQCANASAREQITKLAAREASSSVRIDVPFPHVNKSQLGPLSTTTSPVQKQSNSTSGSSICNSDKGLGGGVKTGTQLDFRRYQKLTIVDLRATTPNSKSRHRETIIHRIFHVAIYLSLFAVAAGALLSNAFGTAAIVLLSCLTKLICTFIPIQRPCGYLSNNESYKMGCMLTAAHDNASSWFLYVGDRGIVDWLLNKNMLSIGSNVSTWLVRYFQAAHYLHLLIMTYVAGQKGWDGLCLLCLMVVTESLTLVLKWDDPVQSWLQTENITCKATIAEVSGRTPMLGAIQLLHDKDLNPCLANRWNSWMDSIIAPSPRLEAWSQCLHKAAQGEDCNTLIANLTGFSDSDLHWIKKNTELSKTTLDTIGPLLKHSTGAVSV